MRIRILPGGIMPSTSKALTLMGLAGANLFRRRGMGDAQGFDCLLWAEQRPASIGFGEEETISEFAG